MSSERGTALVTGGGRGIGFAIGKELRRRNFKVAIASIEPKTGEVDELLKDPHVRHYPFDLAVISSHSELLDRVDADLGRISCLVNNAGVTSLSRGDMLDVTPASFDRSVAVNLRGTFFLTQAVARRFLLQDATASYRSIVTISSINSDIVGDNRADYCLTKSALTMMTKLFAVRLAEAGVAVLEVRPGIIATDMTAPATEKYDAFIDSGGVPMKRWGSVEDVANAVATIACGGLPYATGGHVDIAGGMQVHRV
jgi:NAD(P)-dependent dehydrogenase (short-subunit alcohol dehydrogenase family)